MMLVGLPWVSLEQPVLLSCAGPLFFGALVLVKQKRAQVRPCSGSLFSATAQGFSHLWVWFICLWQGEVLGQRSVEVKLFAQFIYLSSDTRPCESGALSGWQSFLNRVTIDRAKFT